jgi:microcystin-dependent protein
MSGTIPTGTIIALGGPPPAAVTPPLWVSCDGSPYAMDTGPYADLGNVVSSNFGGDGTTVFNVPDLRGRFLRGTSHGTTRDPDSATRTALLQGGNTGDNVGSAQGTATANAATAFKIAPAGDHSHTAVNVPDTHQNEAYGAIGPLAYHIMKFYDSAATQTSSDGLHSHAVTGGDKETRPPNVYVNWLIAVEDVAGAPPIGSVLAFAGDTTDVTVRAGINADGWLACNGDKLRIKGNEDLFAVIGHTYGGDDKSFLLPDLRGLFVMGAGDGAVHRAVGSLQLSSMTRAPQNPFVTDAQGAHTHQITNVPFETHVCDPVAGWAGAQQNDPGKSSDVQGSHTHALGGGDNESRPLNVYVDFIIRFK